MKITKDFKNDFVINILFKVNMTEIYIENYTEKSFVVLGDTRPHKENIKKLGGKWNSRLRDNKMGWIFPMSKRDSVEKYINTFKKTGDIPEIKESQTKMVSMSQKDLENILKRLEKLEQEVTKSPLRNLEDVPIFLNVLKKLEQEVSCLRQEVKELKNKNIDKKIVEENKQKPRRLLKTFNSKYEGRINRRFDED